MEAADNGIKCRLAPMFEAAGVPGPVVGLVVPGGLSFSADGSAIYFTIAMPR
jgi:Na+/H+-dicarboxylate symporter